MKLHILQRPGPLFLILVPLVFTSCARMRSQRALDRLTPCTLAEGPADAYCGHLEAWEDRRVRSGRPISLNIVVLPALREDSAADPLFILAGGPGQAATELAAGAKELFRPILTNRDIVLVDQRGTGRSNPLGCDLVGARTDNEGSQVDLVNRLHECLDSYRGKADVTKYTTDAAMDDLDDVRQFLGYTRIDLYGGSYGSRAAVVYARRHPDQTRAVVLDAVSPTDNRIPLYFARNSQRALGLVLSDCKADATCNHRFPDLQRRFDALLKSLSDRPQRVRSVDPHDGTPHETTVDRMTVVGSLVDALYSPTTSALIPLWIEQAEHGDFGGLLAMRSATAAISRHIFWGMQFSVLCSEDASRIQPGSVEVESRDTWAGPELAEARLKPCAFWPRATMDPEYFDNSPSSIPALILSGQYDPVTPPSQGHLVASQWKNSREIVVGAASHGCASSGCTMKLIAQFLEEGSAVHLDPSCLNELKRPPFFIGPSGPAVEARGLQ